MASLGEKRLYDGILRKLHFSMAFLGLECLSMAFYGFSLVLKGYPSIIQMPSFYDKDKTPYHTEE